ncbi:MAG: beta-propeller fold lactonase family protein [Bacteroidota bacterium]
MISSPNYLRLSIILLIIVLPELNGQSFTFNEHLADGAGGVDGLNGTYGVVVSPDNLHVYTASSTDDAVTVFSRNTETGDLSFVEVHKDNSQSGGLIDGLNAAKRLTISPDGKHLYVPTSIDDALVVFSRNSSTGRLTYVATYHDGVGGVDGLNGAYEAAVSPDGLHVYVAGSSDDAIAAFSRNTSTGELTYITLYRNGIDGVSGLNGARGLKVSSDGLSVYAASSVDDAVAIFSRNSSTGALTYISRIRDGVDGVDGLNSAYGLFISGDNKHVYVVSSSDDAVTCFSRNTSTGDLSFLEVHKDDSQIGGTATYLNAGRGIHGSADGKYIAAASSSDHGLVIFARDSTTGLLSVQQEFTDGASGVDGLYLNQNIYFSPDNKSLYTVSTGDDAITTINAPSMSLPVELIDFRVEMQKGQVRISWSTATEINNDFFELQRSADGLTFETISTVLGAGTSLSTNNYWEIDEEPLWETTYYRLKQVDFDGQFSYSEVVAVDRPPSQSNYLYPNPSTGIIYTSTPFEKVTVFSLEGKNLGTYQGHSTNSIDLSKLSPGTYWLRFEQQRGTWNQRVQLNSTY